MGDVRPRGFVHDNPHWIMLIVGVTLFVLDLRAGFNWIFNLVVFLAVAGALTLYRHQGERDLPDQSVVVYSAVNLHEEGREHPLTHMRPGEETENPNWPVDPEG